MEEKKINLKSKKEIKKKLNSSVKKPKKNANKTPSKVTSKKAPKKIEVKKVEPKKITPKKGVTRKVEPKKVPVKKKVSPKKKPQPKKTELILPREWQELADKSTQTKGYDNLKAKLQEKMFEELEVDIVEKKKDEDKDKFIKIGIVLLSIVFVTLLTLIFFDIYNGKQNILTNRYTEYLVGDKIKLKDDSFWYVVKHSPSNDKELVLLKDRVVDINNDNKFDNNDKIVFNSHNKTEYDITTPDSIGEYLELIYKKKLNNSVGKINEIRLLKSKEFVHMRESLGYPYDWKIENLLAGKSLGNWWIEGANKNNVYAVTTVGAYKLFNPGDYNYIRPVIVIDKDILH